MISLKLNKPASMSFQERFSRSYIPVPEAGCWLWTGVVSPRGYGVMMVSKKLKRAHRVSYEIHHGGIPEGMYVCHKCDTPGCVNPEHLFLGTARDNAVDMTRKGRNPTWYGENHHQHVLKSVEVEEIKSSKEGVVALSKKFKVSHSLISNIRSGKKRRNG